MPSSRRRSRLPDRRRVSPAAISLPASRSTADRRSPPGRRAWSTPISTATLFGIPKAKDNDATNRDFVFNFGEITDAYFTGNFAANTLPGVDRMHGDRRRSLIHPDDVVSSGFDKLGAYGAFNGQYQFFLDTNDDGVGDLVGAMAFQVNAIPVAGNFFISDEDEIAIFEGRRPRDEIGAFDGQNWYLDVNGNNQIDTNEKFPTSLRGIPVVGDFNGDGFDDLVTYNNDTGAFYFDLNRDRDRRRSRCTSVSVDSVNAQLPVTSTWTASMTWSCGFPGKKANCPRKRVSSTSWCPIARLWIWRSIPSQRRRRTGDSRSSKRAV